MRRPLSYFLSRLRRLNLANMRRMASQIAHSGETWMPTPIVMLDMALCAIRFYAGYYDYHEWDFHLLTWKQRATYLTRPQANQLTVRYNDLAYAHFFRNKVEFDTRFDRWLGREWLDVREVTPDELGAFVARHGTVFLKDPQNLGGYGLEKVEASQVTDAAEFHARLLRTGQVLVEQYLTQHPELMRLSPKSVNTLRVITYFDGTDVHVLANAFKMGAGADLDNFGQGGIQTTVYDHGLLPYGAFAKDGRRYTVHPETGVSIVGFTVPFFDEALDLARELARVEPHVPYIGWDIAITPTGPVVIEGNYNSGVFQMKPGLSDIREGLKPVYRAAMGF